MAKYARSATAGLNPINAAFKGLRDFRGDAALSTWLYQIARSFCALRFAEFRRDLDALFTAERNKRGAPSGVGDIHAATNLTCRA